MVAEEDQEKRSAEKDKEEEKLNDKEQELNNNRGLTNAELKEKEKLLQGGFLDWTKDEYHSFVKACEKFGRKAYSQISEVLLLLFTSLNRLIARWYKDCRRN